MAEVRKNICSSSETATTETTDQGANSEDENVISALVVKLFIESITEVDLLKKFRLVNKYWNLEACHSLRKLSMTTLCSCLNYSDITDGLCGDNSEDFHSVLNGGTMLSLPSPFQQLTVHATKVPGNILSTLINRFGLKIKSFNVALLRVEDLDQHTIFLKEYSNQITKLTLPQQWSQLHEAYDKLTLPSLQSLDCNLQADANHTDFVKTVLFRGSPLTTFKMYINSAFRFSLFVSLDLTGIQNLELLITISDSVPVSWDALAKVQLPALKRLQIFVSDHFSNNDEMHFYSFLNKIAPSLESLAAIGAYKIWNANIMFPKLKSLTLDDITLDDLVYFTHEWLPSLKEIRLRFARIDSENQMEFDCVPHQGLQKIKIDRINVEGNSSIEKNQRTESWLITLTKKFPNVQHVTLLTFDGRWTSLCFQQFSRAYPLLKFLKLRGPNDLAALAEQKIEWGGFSGPLTMQNDQRHVNMAAPGTLHPEETDRVSQNIPLTLYIRDFQNLESLVLQQHNVSVETITNYVAHIPKLKYLRMPWCEELSVEIFRDFLQHLEVLEISNFIQWRNTLTQLRAIMPGTLIKARHCTDDF